MIQSFGSKINLHPHLHFLISEGGSDREERFHSVSRFNDDLLQVLPSRGWAEMIRKVYEIDPLICPKCGGTMRIISFIEDHKVIDKIINHLKLTFNSERPPPPAQAQLNMAAEYL